MQKLSDIYGIDDCGMAESISSKALGSTKGKEDVWGSTIDQTAFGKGNTPQFENYDAVKKDVGGGNDGRATSKDNDFKGKD